MKNLKLQIKRIAAKNARSQEKEEKLTKSPKEIKGCCGDCKNITEHISYKYDGDDFRRCPNSLYLASIRFTV